MYKINKIVNNHRLKYLLNLKNHQKFKLILKMNNKFRKIKK